MLRKGNSVLKRYDLGIIIPVFFLLALSFIILRSVSPSLFPNYIWYYIISIDFEVLSVFSKYFYYISIFLLIITIILGQVTRGTVRWIPIGSLSFQPSEIVRPLLLVFFANFNALYIFGKAIPIVIAMNVPERNMCLSYDGAPA